ncbi:MAG: hypothetical protein ACXWRE_15115 [Pseudobdellovibrionaceae bacterium]
MNDSQNSSLQAFSTAYFGMTKSVIDGKKGNTQIGKQVEVLRTREFYEKLIQRLEDRGKNPQLSVEEQLAYRAIKDPYLAEAYKDEQSRQNFIIKLDSWAQAKLESDYEIRISYATPSKELSLFLTNTALELSSEYLRDREMGEINEVEKFINDQKQMVDKNIKSLTQELADFQIQPQNLISMTSREKMGEYLSDLMVRMNEAQLKIEENNKDIEFLQDEKGNEKNIGSSLYGVGGRVEALRLENKMLQSRISQLKNSVSRLGKYLKTLPVAAQMLEDRRKKSELEYLKYKELSETLAKVEAQKLSVRDRFEILERARLDNTSPQVGFVTLLFLSIVVSLASGLMLIYLRYIWRPVSIQKENIRNVTNINPPSPEPQFHLGNNVSLE